MTNSYIAENLAHWEEAVEPHLAAYNTDAFVADPGKLSDVVTIDQDLLAPFLPDRSVAGLELVHLQCHIGTDSLSWARLGARVTGVDFSPAAIAAATALAARAGLADRTRFVVTTNDDAPAALGHQRFDVVYTSVGVLTWLPDLVPWARTIAALLKPDGVFYIREDHPAMMMLDAGPSGDLIPAYSYFPTAEPLLFDEPVDYAGSTHEHTRTYSWPHPLSEIIGCLLAEGLTIEHFGEYDWMEWRPFPSMRQVPGPKATTRWVLSDHPERVPLMFSLVARPGVRPVP